ncbi:MAG: D-glycero-beta-D-manno-heptose 1-phosphate adenylyltransferase [Bacteroidota bacterium]
MELISIIRDKIFSGAEDFLPVCRRWKRAGDKIVFTNGCFDILHRGHIDYLARTAGLGDRLIVGLNSDDSVYRLKGAGRPVMDEESRAFILAALFFVDAVVLFNDDTPESLISKVLPDFLVKGSDYEIHEIAGQDTVLSNGGRVETISLVPGFSTSDIIGKIRKLPQ